MFGGVGIGVFGWIGFYLVFDCVFVAVNRETALFIYFSLWHLLLLIPIVMFPVSTLNTILYLIFTTIILPTIILYLPPRSPVFNLINLCMRTQHIPITQMPMILAIKIIITPLLTINIPISNIIPAAHTNSRPQLAPSAKINRNGLALGSQVQVGVSVGSVCGFFLAGVGCPGVWGDFLGVGLLWGWGQGCWRGVGVGFYVLMLSILIVLSIYILPSFVCSTIPAYPIHRIPNPILLIHSPNITPHNLIIQNIQIPTPQPHILPRLKPELRIGLTQHLI